MKKRITLTLISQDAITYALQGVSDKDKESIRNTLAQWIKFGEYITLEIDTENNTCVPIPVRK